jgi:hypothetical protein
MSAREMLSSARRLFSRTEIPMRLIVAGEAVPVLNWSLGGLALPRPCAISPLPGQAIAGSLELLVGGVGLSVNVTLRLAHQQRDRYGFSFVDLTPEQMGMLRALLMRGGASPLERAPAPAIAASADPQPERPRARRPRRAAGIGRWAMRTAAGVGLVAAFAAIAGYGLVKKSHVESAQAAVAVPTRVASVGDRGYVEAILVKPGQTVPAGEPLVSIRRRAEPAKAVVITSPCACTVLDVLAQPGSDVVVNQPLIQLTAAEPTEPFIEALVPADTELPIGHRVPVRIEGQPQVGSGRILAIDAARAPVGRYGLPPQLRQDPRYRLVIVGELTGLGPLAPGQSARLELSQAMRWQDLLRREADRLAARVERLTLPLRPAGDAAAG